MLQATTKGGSQSVTGVTTATVIVAGMSAAATTTDASGSTRVPTDRIEGAMMTMTEIIAGEDLKVS
jgi:hypothetical protein